MLRDEDHHTMGGFVNYIFDVGSKLSFETGFRGDYVFGQQFYALPRVSALFKWTQKLTTRIGGGMGYRNPTVFNQEAELLGYRNVLPINKKSVSAEQSYGGNVDIGFKTLMGEHYFINFNQLFFITYLTNPLIIADTGSGSGIFYFMNANGYTTSYGSETFFKFGFYDFVLFAGYTYTHASNYFNGTQSALTLTPQHSLKGDLLYAVPGKWRIGADYEFKSFQVLGNGKNTPSYWTYGLVVERTIKKYTMYLNVENFTNVRQTNFSNMRSAPNNTPQFTEVWAPLDGIVFNAGIKIRL